MVREGVAGVVFSTDHALEVYRLVGAIYRAVGVDVSAPIRCVARIEAELPHGNSIVPLCAPHGKWSLREDGGSVPVGRFVR